MSAPDDRQFPIPPKAIKQKDFRNESKKMYYEAMKEDEKLSWGRLDFLNDLVSAFANDRFIFAMKIVVPFALIAFLFGWSIAFQVYVVLPALGGL